MIRYSILEEYELVIECMIGDVFVDNLVLASEQIWNDDDYDKKYDAIIDIRRAEVRMAHGDIGAFADLLLSSADTSTGKAAILSSKPTETALGYLFSKRIQEQVPIEVFSTWEAVGAFLRLPPSLMAILTDDQAYDALFD